MGRANANDEEIGFEDEKERAELQHTDAANKIQIEGYKTRRSLPKQP